MKIYSIYMYSMMLFYWMRLECIITSTSAFAITLADCTYVHCFRYRFGSLLIQELGFSSSELWINGHYLYIQDRRN